MVRPISPLGRKIFLPGHIRGPSSKDLAHQTSSRDNTASSLVCMTPSVGLTDCATEISQHIKNYLPPASQMALQYTCRTTYLVLGLSLEKIIKPPALADGNTASFSDDAGTASKIVQRARLELLCMLNRDHLFGI